MAAILKFAKFFVPYFTPQIDYDDEIYTDDQLISLMFNVYSCYWF